MSLTQLGHPSRLPKSPDAAVLETVPNPHPGLVYLVRFTCPEFTSLSIARRLVETLAPQWLRIGGYWYPRGGIPIDVFYQTGEPPAGLWLPDPGIAPYRGRG